VAEIDRDIIARLKKEFPPERLTIHEGDALKFDFGSITDGAFKIVGNLPYNISTPLLFHLASFGQRVTDMHFMLQKKWWTACWPSLPRRFRSPDGDAAVPL
jgi:16S rRNA (adenine1518-N6/adenine1519-N6)-dimethyltransferase